MIRKLLFIAIVGVVAFGSYEIGQRGARAYERRLTERVTSALDVIGYGWARVEADGLRLAIYGHAPDIAARDLALQSARATVPMARVVSYATATLAPPEHRDPVRVELLRDERGITLTGQTASRSMRSRLNAALAEDGPGLSVQDLTGIQAAQPPRGWGPEIWVASLAASRLDNAYVVMESGRVMIEGQAADEADREAVTQALLERAGDKVALVLNVRVPAQVIAPFAFSARKDAGAGLRLERCAARSYEEQAALRERLTRAAVEHPPEACPLGLGGPGGDWSTAVAAGLDALAALPAGRIDIEYRDARLFGSPPTTAEAFADVLDSFRAAMPEGFVAGGELRDEDLETEQRIARDRYWMTLRREDGGVTLSGQVPDAAARTAVETEARALYGGAAVRSELTLADAPPPAGWQGAALRALGALNEIGGGEARLAGDRLLLHGRIDEPEDARLLHDRLASALPEFRVETRLHLDLPAKLAALPLPAEACAAALNRANRGPALDFAPGSTDITAESAAALAALVAAFERCGPAPVEVAGHTDSKGSEETNLRISQERAEAVVRALAERGVPADRLVARGYGEAAPIASNETESGRARNRRIEFGPAG